MFKIRYVRMKPDHTWESWDSEQVYEDSERARDIANEVSVVMNRDHPDTDHGFKIMEVPHNES